MRLKKLWLSLALLISCVILFPGALGAITNAKEAPTLAELVNQGKLPPVAQRLPENPVVVQPVEKVGTYGGTWHIGMVGTYDHALLFRTIGYEALVRWDPTWSKIVPNIAESFQSNSNATLFTFKLRKGMKWSDGEPFTADDIMFWYEDVLLNKDLTPAIPDFLVTGGKTAVVKKIDTYTVTFQFASPYGLFLQQLATPDPGNYMVSKPVHYLKQFHKKYNPNIDKLVKDAGLSTWVDLWIAKGGGFWWQPGFLRNLDLPRLWAWNLKTPYDGKATQVIWERNPYYWNVDTEGNQLPYIDKVEANISGDAQTLLLNSMNGNIDMQDRNVGTPVNKPMLTDNMTKGNYRFYKLQNISLSSQYGVALNLTCKDLNLRKIFQNKDFRIGLSYAINRQEMIDTLLVGQGIPYGAGPRPSTPYYSEKLATEYLEFNAKNANDSLDKAGFSKKDSSGLRLGPNGKPIEFTMETAFGASDISDSFLMLQRYFKAVGITMHFKLEDGTLYFQRYTNNDIEATLGGANSGTEMLLSPQYVVPAHQDNKIYAIAWTWWYLKDPRGEEPPAPLKKTYELYQQVKETADETKQNRLMKQIVDIAADEFWLIGGIQSTATGYGIQKNNFHNVPSSMPTAWFYPNPAPTNPCQYYID